MNETGLENEYIGDYLGHILRHGDYGWNSQAGAAELEASSKRLFSKRDLFRSLSFALAGFYVTT